MFCVNCGDKLTAVAMRGNCASAWLKDDRRWMQREDLVKTINFQLSSRDTHNSDRLHNSRSSERGELANITEDWGCHGANILIDSLASVWRRSAGEASESHANDLNSQPADFFIFMTSKWLRVTALLRSSHNDRRGSRFSFLIYRRLMKFQRDINSETFGVWDAQLFARLMAGHSSVIITHAGKQTTNAAEKLKIGSSYICQHPSPR